MNRFQYSQTQLAKVLLIELEQKRVAKIKFKAGATMISNYKYLFNQQVQNTYKILNLAVEVDDKKNSM